ncbi:MAG TPA: hypothetical protein VGX78_04440 [Pirellulales bacterium]|jgi:hypothetical protein|nr:hypothetical protein [Pirellulales bacterium]
MAMKKDGDLRVLKGSALYGPMTRSDLERLLDRGRLDPTDQVSMLDGPWMAIGEYLAQGPCPAAPVAETQPPKPVAKGGNLRLLKGNKVYSSLSRGQIDDLRAKGRVDDDDLLCAHNGPWMRLGDFFAPPSSATRSAAPPIERRAAPRPIPQPTPHRRENVQTREDIFGHQLESLLDDITKTEAVSGDKQVPAEANGEIVEAVEVVEPSAGGDDDVEVLHVPGGHHVDDLLHPSIQLSDDWFVRVKGIHSAPLKKQHVKMLYQAREITLDCLARHASWPTEHWVPIQSIPELADVAAA